MDLLTILITVVRRWPVVLVVFLATLAGVQSVTSRAIPEYEATGTLLLHQTQDQSSGDVEGSTAVTNTFVIAEVMNSGDMRASVAEEGFVGDYNAQAEMSGILRVVVTGEEPDGLADTVLAILNRAREETVARQSMTTLAVPSDVFEILSVPTTATVDARYRMENPEATDTRYVARGSALITPLTVEQNVFQPDAYTIRVLAEAMQSQSVVDEVRAEGLRSSFVVSNLPRDPAPIMYLTTSGSDPADVLASYDHVASVLSRRLAELQEEAGADPTTVIQVHDLASPQQAVLLTTNRTRPAVALAGLGLIASVTLALLVDAIIARRKLRAERRPDPDGGESDGGDDLADDGLHEHAPAGSTLPVGWTPGRG